VHRAAQLLQALPVAVVRLEVVVQLLVAVRQAVVVQLLAAVRPAVAACREWAARPRTPASNWHCGMAQRV
jgi:hypothetical protein